MQMKSGKAEGSFVVELERLRWLALEWEWRVGMEEERAEKKNRNVELKSRPR